MYRLAISETSDMDRSCRLGCWVLGIGNVEAVKLLAPGTAELLPSFPLFEFERVSFCEAGFDAPALPVRALLRIQECAAENCGA